MAERDTPYRPLRGEGITEERELVFNTDARVWAKAFVERFTVRPLDGDEFTADDAEGLMLGWFTNAMEACRPAYVAQQEQARNVSYRELHRGESR